MSVLHLKQADPLLSLHPEHTTPAAGGGWPRHKADTKLTGSGDPSRRGSFCFPSSPKSLQQRVADRWNGWVSFKRCASTCLIVQGHIEQINKTTLMYGEADKVCFWGVGGWGIHTWTGSESVLSQFPNLSLDVSGMQHRALHRLQFICAFGLCTVE